MTTENLLLWLDFETTGSIDEGSPMEVGAILTDTDFTPVGTEFHSYIRLPVGFKKEEVDSVVIEMHYQNNLWYDYNNYGGYIYNAGWVDLNLLNWIYDWTLQYKKDHNLQDLHVVLAGEGVSHFDSEFLKRYFPETWTMIKGHDWHHKPTLDISVLRRFFKIAGVPSLIPPDYEGLGLTPHRALDDVKLFICRAQWLQSTLKEITDFYEKQTGKEL